MTAAVLTAGTPAAALPAGPRPKPAAEREVQEEQEERKERKEQEVRKVQKQEKERKQQEQAGRAEPESNPSSAGNRYRSVRQS
jgi:hypothetical protein